ncbi:MAG TPA: septum formation initiator family protein [Candidatus Paceibacterota bacterium]
MFSFKKKKTYKKIIYSPFAIFALVIVLAFFLKALWGVYKKEQMSAEYLEREKSELQKLEKRQNNLAKSVDYLKTDKGIEAEIRNKFRLVKEGESVTIIIDNEISSTPKNATTSFSGFWKSLFGWFDRLF